MRQHVYHESRSCLVFELTALVDYPVLHADVVKVRTQASEASKAAAGSAHPQAAAISVRSRAVAQIAKSSASAAGKRSFCSHARGAAVPPGLYSGPAVGVYRHIIKTEGVLGVPPHCDSTRLGRASRFQLRLMPHNNLCTSLATRARGRAIAHRW